MSARSRTPYTHIILSNAVTVGIKTLSSLSLSLALSLSYRRKAQCTIYNRYSRNWNASQSWSVGDNSGSVEGRKLLRIKARIDENGGSNIRMLMFGKLCNEQIDLINTQTNLY